MQAQTTDRSGINQSDLFMKGFLSIFLKRFLQCEEHQEGNHETEEAHGFGQSETEDCVREQLLLERRISSVAGHQASEDGSNSYAWDDKIGS